MVCSIFVRVQWLKALYLCRAIFHDVVFEGRSLPFFQSCKLNIEQ
ncbi:RAxF-45 family protein [Neobacillus niacini]